MIARVELSKRARKDLDKLDVATGRRVIGAVDRLRLRPLPANLDMKPLQGHDPWLRLRVGKFRVLLRPMSASELRSGSAVVRGFLVERVVDRRDLDEAIKPL